MTEQGFFEDLINQVDPAFKQLAHERRRRARLLRALAAAAVVILVAGATLVARDTEPAAAGVRVTREHGDIIVRLTDVEFRPDVIEHAASGAGLDVDVTAVATGPSLVGRFVREEASGALEEVHLLGRQGDSFVGFRVKEGWRGHLELDVGRPADGHPYVVFPNAVSRGEALACVDIVGRAAATAVKLVRDARIDASWHVQTRDRGFDISTDEITKAAWRDATVRYALATSDSTVRVFLSTNGGNVILPRLTPAASC